MELTGQTVLVTGASGFIGGALARRLAAEGAQVRALMRHPTDLGVAGLAPVKGDLRDATSLRAAAEGCSAVFHCAAHMTERDAREAEEVTVGGTRRLIEAMVAAGARRLIHVSTAGVYATTPPPRSEDASLRPCKGVYNRTKQAAEREIRAAELEGRITATILRPPSVYGPGSPMWTRGFARRVQRGGWPVLGDGQGRWHYVYVDNLVDALVLAAQNDRAGGRTYNIVDGTTTWLDWLERHRRVVGGPPPRRLPLGLVRQLTRLLGGRFGLPYAENLSFMTVREDDGYDARRAREELGWSPRVPLDEGIRRALEWFATL